MARVFLSYASVDRAKAVAVRDALESRHISVWIDDREIRVGDDIRRRIETGLADSDFFLILLSQAAVASPWVQAELSSALSRKITDEKLGSVRAHILPVLLEDCAVPALLAGVRMARLGEDFDSGIDDIVATVGPSRTQEMSIGNVSVTLYRSGDMTEPNKIEFGVIGLGEAILACLIEGTGASPSNVGAVLTEMPRLLPLIIENSAGDPSAILRLSLTAIDLMVHAERVANSGLDGAKVAAALITPFNVYTARIGDTGGFIIMRLAEENDLAMRRLDNSFHGTLSLPRGRESLPSVQSYPLGYLEPDWDVTIDITPFVAGATRVVLSSGILPAIEEDVRYRKLNYDLPRNVLATRAADLGSIAPGENFVSVCIESAAHGEPSAVLAEHHVRNMLSQAAESEAEGQYIMGMSRLDVDLRGALEQLRKAHQLQPENVEYAVSLVEVLAENGEPDEAKSLLSSMIGRVADGEALAQLGSQALDCEWFELAAEAYGKAAEADPDSSYFHFFHGRSLKEIDGAIESAIAAFRRSAELDPGDPYTQQWLGSSLILAGRPSEAIVPLRLAVSIEPSGGNHHWLGIALTQVEDWEHGESYLRLANAEDPGRMDTIYWLAVALGGRSVFQDAIKYMKQVLFSLPSSMRESALDLLAAWMNGRHPPSAPMS